jgi:Tfp pilus assembly protein PilF
MADLQLSKSNLMETTQALGDFLKVNPWQSGYQLRLAATEGNLGQLDDAAIHAKEALRINPTLSSAHFILAEVYQRQGKHDQAEYHRKMTHRLQSPK